MRAVLAVITALAVAHSAMAQSPDWIKTQLSKQLLAPTRTLEETQTFCAARIPPMPECKSVEEWEQHAQRIRQDVLDRVVFRGEAAVWRDAPGKVEWLETMDGGPGYKLKKLRYEALPGLWIPAILYKPETLAEKTPVFLNVNGHDGAGKAAKYKQIRCINMAKRGILALNVEWLGMGQLQGPGYQHYKMNQLDLCGTSGLAPFYLAMKRGLDVLLSLEHADPTRVGVAGLSGGGWQTIVISSLDTRVTLANPVAGYSSFLTRNRNFSDLGDSEQTPCDLATAADYAHLTGLMAPRSLLLTYNDKDNCCFATGHALPPLLEAAEPLYKLYKSEEKLRAHRNADPGTHNFEIDNRQALYRMIGDRWYPGGSFKAEEIPSDDEVKTKEDLTVEVPAENATFNTLAKALALRLPRTSAPPDTTDRGWHTAAAKTLAEIVKPLPGEVRAEAVGTESSEKTKSVAWKLQVGEHWTVPVIEFSPESPKETVVILGDAGKVGLTSEIETALKAGKRVLAVDPWYFGECKVSARDFLFGLLVSAVGQRPLGLQAGQLQSVCRWAKSDLQAGPVTVMAHGPRTSLIALVTAALETDAIAGVELHGSMTSLKEVIETNKGVNEAPELFCFGLLEHFDLPLIAEIVKPRRVERVPATQEK
jgi:hypothetical protein